MSKCSVVNDDMIKIKKDIHNTQLYTVWFAEKPVTDAGIIQYKEARFKNDRSEDFITLESDLTESEEDIKAHFSKGCKYKVNRAYREDITFHIFENDAITDEMLNSFLDFFEEFWASKGTGLSDRASLFDEMIRYRNTQALTLAFATVNSVPAVYHTHIFDDRVARLLHSASLYRLKGDEEGNTKNIIGMANRALHFEEIKYFKLKGISVYDWGGAGTGEDVASITEFKESFGGKHVVYNEFETVNGMKAHMINGLSGLKHKIKG